MSQNPVAFSQKNICDDVIIAIRRINQSVSLHSRYLARHFGLTGPQLIILKEISKRQQVAIGEIAKGVSLGQPTVTGILERLEKQGLIIRKRSTSDKRKVFISITDTCQKLLEKAPPGLQEHFIKSFESLEDWEQTMILASLKRLVHLMDAKSIQVAPMLIETGTGTETSDKDF